VASPRRRHPGRPGDDLLTRITVVWLVGAALIAAVAGCGGGKHPASPVTTTTPTLRSTTVRLYYLMNGRVRPTALRVETPQAAAADRTAALIDATLFALTRQPSGSVRARGFSSAVPDDVHFKNGPAPRNGTVAVEAGGHVSRLGLAQVVYSLTQFPTVKTVELGGKRYTRADFEDETPIILVESPLPDQKVKSPLHATGTANTFEATFQYDLVGSDGKLLKSHFVTATSGSGTRGTFDFSVPFTVDRAGPGKLIVYERSAENGRRIHQVEIPIQLEK
jgi:immunoglobulin-like protein involved in spore germination/sporulation and spore germination protein